MSRPKNYRAERLNLQLLITYGKDNRQITKFCSNLGETGVFIETYETVPVGTDLSLTFSLPIERKEFSLLGRVKWIKKSEDNLTDDGMGLEFIEVDPATVALLKRAVTILKQIMEQK